MNAPAPRAAWLAVVAAWFAASLCVARPAAAQLLETVQVPMPDGTTLATDVWKPAIDDGPRPVVLRRTPYGRAFDAGAVSGFSSLGYIFVSQDVRGRGDSAGAFSPFRDDALDGAATIAWIAAQPWSNGRVGSVGGSAEGIVQLMAAGEAPPALQCVHALVATDDVYEALYPGGAWRSELGSAWLTALDEPQALTDFRAHELGDAYWDSARVDANERAGIQASLLLVGGVYDIFALGTRRTFRQARESAPAGDRTFMVLGPWTHGGPTVSQQGQLSYPEDSAYQAYVDDLIAYFGWCLKDEPRPSWPAVRYYLSELGDDGVSATGSWRDSDVWPPPSSPLLLHLRADGGLSRKPPADDEAAAVLPIDPNAPVPSLGGGNLTTPAGPHEQAAVDARDDVLVLSTPVMTETVEIIGDVRAEIIAASASSDLDVVVRLEVLTPSGRALNVADGVRRGRFVQGFDAIRPLTPAAPASFAIDVGPVALSLPPGYALRLALSGSSSPHYEPNPNVAEPIATATPLSTTLTLFRDAARASTLTLPLASGTWPESAPTQIEDDSVSEASCGCRLVGRRAGGNSAAPVLLALLGLAAFRRRPAAFSKMTRGQRLLPVSNGQQGPARPVRAALDGGAASG